MENKNICAAVAAAISDVYILGKEDKNQHQNYSFVSIDKFLEHVNPICAKHKLFPSVNMEHVEYYNASSRNGEQQWGRFNFEITLIHESGESLPKTKLTVPLQINGAQSSGSAQSYALKQYFRSLFMIPTGDKDDADFRAQVDHIEVIETKQVTFLEAEIEKLDVDKNKFCQFFKISSVNNLPKSKYKEAVDILIKKEVTKNDEQ